MKLSMRSPVDGSTLDASAGTAGTPKGNGERKEIETMAALALAVPILPGKADAFRRFSREALGPRGREQEESRRQTGLTKELGWIQSTPMGDLLIIYLEGENPVRANQEFVMSTSPYDRWFKEQIREITGVDFNQPPPWPLPELAFDWQAR